MGVHLRKRKVKNGFSFYLDIYHNKNRWYEPLEITINNSRPTEQDKKNLLLAKQLRAKRETELFVKANDLVDTDRQKTDFIAWVEHSFMPTKKNRNCYSGLLYQLKDFANGHWEPRKHSRRKNGNDQPHKPLLFAALNRDKILLFQRFLFGRVKNNGVFIYMKNLNTAIRAAVRQGYLKQSPFFMLERHEKAKLHDTKITAWTIDELTQLANNYPLRMDPQIRQGFLFSCFCGLRWVDTNSLKWSEIVVKKVQGVERWFIYFSQSKTSAVDYLPLSAQVIEILKERKAEMEHEPESEYIFPALAETNHKTKRKWNWVKYWLKKWAAFAKMDKRMHYHTARHSFATNLLDNDVDLYTVSKLLIHSTVIISQKYAKVRDKKKNEAVDRLPVIKMNSPNNPFTPVIQIKPASQQLSEIASENISLIDLVLNQRPNEKDIAAA